MKRCQHHQIERNANQNFNEVSPHTGQNGHRQKLQKQMLERLWTKGNPLTLILGMETGSSHSGGQHAACLAMKMGMKLDYSLTPYTK